jgi:hypothetical protein
MATFIKKEESAINNKDLELYYDFLTFGRKIHILWNIFWIGSDQKKINDRFDNITMIIFEYQLIARETLNLDMNFIWKELKKKITENDLKELSKISKTMNLEEIQQSKDIYNEIFDIYKKY